MLDRTGTLTRGMMVVDRRRSAGVPSGLPSRQTNRAMAVEEVETLQKLNRLTIAGTPADATSEGPGPEGERGTKVVIATPGGDTLRTLLLERIWGVSIGLP